MHKSQEEMRKSQREARKELEASETRIRKLDGIIQQLYEDNVEGKISDERFRKLDAGCEEEQQTLTARVRELREQLADTEQNATNTDDFLAIVRKYTDIQELTPEIIREFVEKVYVYQPERVDGHKVSTSGLCGTASENSRCRKRKTVQPTERLYRYFRDCKIPKLHRLLRGAFFDGL